MIQGLSPDNNILHSELTPSSISFGIAGHYFQLSVNSNCAHIKPKPTVLIEMRKALQEAEELDLDPNCVILKKLECLLNLMKRYSKQDEISIYCEGEKVTRETKSQFKQVVCAIVDQVVPLIEESNFSKTFAFKEVYPGVISVTTDSLFVLNYAFLRFAEHFESPEFKGLVFTRDEFCSWYRSQNEEGCFTYYDDWGGWNIPVRSLLSFVNAGFKDLVPIESFLVDSLKSLLKDRSSECYIIGTCNFEDPEYFEHETAHAFFALDPNYKREVLDIVARIPQEQVEVIHNILISYGYDQGVLEDETQAFLLHLPKYFKDLDWAEEGADFKILEPYHLDIQRVFIEYEKAKRFEESL